MKSFLIFHSLFLLILLPFAGKCQLYTISGNVFHGDNGQPMEDVSIFESSALIGTITDENGYFKLMLTRGEQNISISDNGFIKYSTRLVLSSDTTLTVMLNPKSTGKNKNKKAELLSADSGLVQKNATGSGSK